MSRFQHVSRTIVATIAAVSQAAITFAQVTVPTVGQVSPNVELTKVIRLAANYLLGLAGALAVVYLIYGGIMYIIGGEKGAEKAKQMIINAITGLVIIALASLLAQLVLTIIGA